MKIYIVAGETGEYEDHYDWTLGAYSTETEAERIANALNAKLETFGALLFKGACDEYVDFENAEQWMRDIDPNCRIDYTGASYFYYETTLDEPLPIEEHQ